MDEVAFGRYRLLSLLGEGGMGKVYRAHDTVIGRDVAIKVLPAELANEPGYRERFRREAHIVARLSEPHIIPIHDTGEIDGQLYLVMPIIDGVDVGALLKRDGPMSPQRAVQVVEQLAAALDAAHAVGLVHRDVKPSNALLMGRDFVYLIDFGIAHDAAATKLTGTGMMMGTMAYMAPERFGTGTADARADIYALACVLHECLTGAQPYPGDSLEQQVAGHLTVAPPKPSATNPTLPTAFDAVIAAGMAKQPDQRYQSAHDLAVAAQQALTGNPSRDPHSAPTRFDPQFPPGPTQPVNAHAGATQFASVPMQPGPPNFGPPPGPGPRKSRTARWVAATVAAVAIVGLVAYLVWPSKTETTAEQADQSAVKPVPTSTTPQPVLPVAAADLEGLMLSEEKINAAMGATAMTEVHTFKELGINPPQSSDPQCAGLIGPVVGKVYAGSGWSAIYGLLFADQSQSVIQAVVAFPSAPDAVAFFAKSERTWAACSDRKITLTLVPGLPSETSVGPLSNVDDTLSVTQTGVEIAVGVVALSQRALTVANNVVIDVYTLSYTPSSAAVDIAHQIAAKVPAP